MISLSSITSSVSFGGSGPTHMMVSLGCMFDSSADQPCISDATRARLRGPPRAAQNLRAPGVSFAEGLLHLFGRSAYARREGLRRLRLHCLRLQRDEGGGGAEHCEAGDRARAEAGGGNEHR